MTIRTLQGLLASLLSMALMTVGCTAGDTSNRIEAAVCAQASYATFRTFPSSYRAPTRILVGPDSTNLPIQETWLLEGNTTARRGADVAMTGVDPSRPGTSIAQFDVTSCATSTVTPASPAWFQTLTTDGAGYLATTMNGRNATLLRLDASGVTISETELGEMLTSATLVSENDILVIGASFDEQPRPSVIVLDRRTLQVRRSIYLHRTNLMVMSAELIDGRLYYPVTLDGTTEATSLGVVDIATGEQSSIELGSPAPMLVRRLGRYLFVGHKFLSPQPSYRHVSRIDVATGKVTGFDASGGIVQIEPSQGSLLVVATDAAGEPSTVETYDPESLERTSSAPLPPGRKGEMFGGILPLHP